MINSQQVQFISKALYITTFTLLLVVLPCAFIHEKTSRVIFYWCGYLSLAGLLLNAFKKEEKINFNRITFSFLMLSVLFLGWSLLSGFLSGEKSSELLYTPGKRWLIAAIISLFILNGKDNLKKFPSATIIVSVMTLAFIVASTYGILQGINSDTRILLGINRATLTAYAFSAFSLAFSAIIAATITTKKKYLFQLIVLIISTYIIFLTQTRAAMLIHPLLGLLLLLSWMWRDKLLNFKTLILSVLSLAVVASLNSRIIINRIDSTMIEIREYNLGNDHTSLGARFSMWKLGAMAFAESPFGQSETHRNNEIINFLKNANEKSEAAGYLTVHLHNEFIQYASIFGIFGILVLFVFFFMLIFKSSHPAIIGPIGIPTLAVLFYGSTDVLLTSIELIVIFSTTIILSSMASNYWQGASK
ncbi:O-antigen ligase family protein [Enterobacter bugandensis]|uniref:O-antigen ligase family protein n=1 Tax=Enterobacter bugandensis TaxID=881260 RepID=A0AA42PPS3_9ENTR|nr:O-antigen ligase family protein [Enterobacter bugandensis]MDH1318564.1 O-antigen ligase family protein [Enterobacter bugandensis]